MAAIGGISVFVLICAARKGAKLVKAALFAMVAARALGGCGMDRITGNMKAIILIGGLGTRLRPLTCYLPKSLVPVLNRPLLEHVISSLSEQGIKEIILAAGFLADLIQEEMKDGSHLGVRISYSLEQRPLGTSGAVKNAEMHLDGTFAVLNGDMLTGIDLRAMARRHKETGAKATLALTPVSDPTLYGVVEADARGMVTAFVEKPSWDKVKSNMISAGVYLLEPEVLKHVPAGAPSMFENDLFPRLLALGERVLAHPSDAYWIDIGAPEKYLKANLDLLELDGKIVMQGSSAIHPQARIEAPALIGAGCTIGAGARVSGTVLGPGCSIAENAVVERSVLWDRVAVWHDARLESCVIGSDTVVEERCRLQECVAGHHVVFGREVWDRGAKVTPHARVDPFGTTTPVGPPSQCPGAREPSAVWSGAAA